MILDKSFIDSQAKSQTGFIVELKAQNDVQKAIVAEVKSFKEAIKNSGAKLNKDFYNQVSGILNFAILNGQSVNEVITNLNALNAEVQQGIYAAVAPKQNYAKQNYAQNTNQGQDYAKQNNVQGYAQNNTGYSKQNYSKNTEATSANTQEKKKFVPQLNEQGFVMVWKPKNENQEAISAQFEEFYLNEIKGKGFSKDFINSFNNSRNYFTSQEIGQDEINAYFEKTLKKIENGEAVSKNSKDNSLEDRIKALEEQVAVLMKNQQTTQVAQETTSEAVSQNSQEQNSAVLQKYNGAELDPNDNSAMNEFRNEAATKNQHSAPQRSYAQSYRRA